MADVSRRRTAPFHAEAAETLVARPGSLAASTSVRLELLARPVRFEHVALAARASGVEAPASDGARVRRSVVSAVGARGLRLLIDAQVDEL